MTGARGAVALIVALAGTAAVELNAIRGAPAEWPYLPGIVAAAVAVVLAGAIASLRWSRLARCVSASGGALLLAAPLLWATTPLDGGAAGLPYASPELLRGPTVFPRPPAPAASSAARAPVPGMDDMLLRYLVAERRGETFVVAAATAGTVAPVIVATGEAAMAIGGFSGSDPILDRTALLDLLRAGVVRFVLVEDRMRAELREVLTSSCSLIPETAWRGARPPAAAPARPQRGPALPPQPVPRLYDCGGLRV